MVATALELPADLLSIVGLNWIGRRWSSAISLSVCGTTMFCCALLPGILDFCQAQSKLQLSWKLSWTEISFNFDFTTRHPATHPPRESTEINDFS